MDECMKNHARQKSNQLLIESRKRKIADDSVTTRCDTRDDMLDAKDMAVATDDQMGLERLAEQFLTLQDKRQKKSSPEVGGSSSSKDVHVVFCENPEQVEANPSKGQRVDRGKCELGVGLT